MLLDFECNLSFECECDLFFLLHREHDLLLLSFELECDPLHCEHDRFLVLDDDRDLLRPLDLDRDCFLSLECERFLSLEREWDLLEWRLFLLLCGDPLWLLS